MFTKGFSLLETLLALALSCLLLLSALSCQWFARRSFQISLEQMTAMHLLIDISHSTDSRRFVAGQSVAATLAACMTCDAQTLQHLQSAAAMLTQGPGLRLKDPELCTETAGGKLHLILSWKSAVVPAADAVQRCGGGSGRRQVMLELPT
ncbi:prepilin-type N-terminal cleavage/methylation domain-containing protein [Rheinheimera texasensis]|uniref:prepilin-type N-terminal cleavage/methylation domain-containing protein n=1 Tax=Rheinheimera texasensis TaxID=306205 RepID=UPI0032B2EFD9